MSDENCVQEKKNHFSVKYGFPAFSLEVCFMPWDKIIYSTLQCQMTVYHSRLLQFISKHLGALEGEKKFFSLT